MDPNTQQQPIQNPTPPAQTRQIPVQNKKLLFIVGGAFLVLAIVIGIFFMTSSRTDKNQEIVERADPLIATVGKYEIHESTLWQQASQEYEESAINTEVLNGYLNTQIERRILDIEAEKNNIVVTDEEVDAETNSSDTDSVRFNAYYSLLKGKLTNSMTHYKTAQVISFWLPPFVEPQKPEWEAQRETGERALKAVEPRLKRGDNIYTIMQTIYTEYPTMQKIIAINGYTYDTVRTKRDLPNYLQPKEYVLNGEGMNTYLTSLLNTTQTGDSALTVHNDGTGASLVYVISEKLGDYTSYNDFLEKKKSEYVTIHKKL